MIIDPTCHGRIPEAQVGPSSSLDKNPGGYCPNHATGVKLQDGFVVTPLQYVD